MPSDIIDSSLCNKCHQFFSDWPAFLKRHPDDPKRIKSQYNIPYHSKLSCWREAARSGCPLCILSLWQLKAALRKEDQQYKIVDIEEVQDLKIQLTGWFHEGVWKCLYFTIPANVVVVGDYHDPSIILVLGLSPSMNLQPSTGSDQAMLLIKRWLDDCVASHPQCKSEDLNVSVFPTRLLCVSNNQLKLIHTSSLPQKPSYFVLSHCWGLIKILRLLKENASSFQTSIPESLLSKTFQDAVQITRKLGCEYIWIDSLCIIQDSESDWRHEASKMAGVYGGALLSMAASGARDGSIGCFFDRDEEMLKQIHKYPLQLPVGEDGQKLGLFTPVDTSNYTEYMQDSPLVSRGWVFQERFLAPRTIHFTASQLYFTCRENTACETYQSHLPLDTSSDMRTVERTDVPGIWRSVVHNYTQCKLTFAKDKLIAISGVAKWLQLRNGDDYVAGLWKSRLEMDLLWEVQEVSPLRPENEMPSWSWATFDRTVFMPPDKVYGKNYTIMAKVVSIDLKYVGKDTFGEIKSGSLKLLTGPLIPAKISQPQKYQSRAALLNGNPAQCNWYKDYEPVVGSESTWYFLPLIKWPERDGKENFNGLMVERVVDRGRGNFRRVGTFAYQPSSGRDNFSEAMKDSKCWAEESLYQDLAGVDEIGRPRFHICLV